MNKVELIARFEEKIKKTDEEIQSEYINSLTQSEPEPSSKYKIEYFYDPMVLDLDNVDEFLMYDDKITQLNMLNGKAYYIKLPFEAFCALYEQLTKTIIQKPQFVFEEPKPKRTRKTKQVEDFNNI